MNAIVRLAVYYIILIYIYIYITQKGVKNKKYMEY